MTAGTFSTSPGPFAPRTAVADDRVHRRRVLRRLLVPLERVLVLAIAGSPLLVMRATTSRFECHRYESCWLATVVETGSEG